MIGIKPCSIDKGNPIQVLSQNNSAWPVGVLPDLGIVMNGVGSRLCPAPKGFRGFAQSIGENHVLVSEEPSAIKVTQFSLWERDASGGLQLKSRIAPPDFRVRGWDVNQNGTVVGNMCAVGKKDPHAQVTAFICEGDSIVDLNTLLEEPVPYQLITAQQINTSGCILCYARSTHRPSSWERTPEATYLLQPLSGVGVHLQKREYRAHLIAPTMLHDVLFDSQGGAVFTAQETLWQWRAATVRPLIAFSQTEALYPIGVDESTGAVFVNLVPHRSGLTSNGPERGFFGVGLFRDSVHQFIDITALIARVDPDSYLTCAFGFDHGYLMGQIHHMKTRKILPVAIHLPSLFRNFGSPLPCFNFETPQSDMPFTGEQGGFLI